jgi:DNA-directed RNA polymerase specialized sigma24 family protein
MNNDGSITRCIAELLGGNQDAAQILWERYFPRLVRLARAHLGQLPRRAADEEDVALSAFDSFCEGAGKGHFPRLEDRDDLWPLLVVITKRKAIDLIQHERCARRGGGLVEGESALDYPGQEGAGIEQVLGHEPTPEEAAAVAEELRGLLAALGDDGLRSVAQWKLEGHTNDEIAARLGCVTRTVERKLEVIRSIWVKSGRIQGRNA